MEIAEHPSGYISLNLAKGFRKLSAEAEVLAELHPSQLEKIYERNLFNLFVPKKYGGLELSLPEGLRVEEALAWADGSVGWTVTLCSGANWFVGFFKSHTAKEIFSTPKACLAGSGRACGIAKITDDGFEVSGTWKYATGAPHATNFTANCLLEKDGQQVKDRFGNPAILSCWFRKDEVTLLKDWNCMGMVATASHSFEVKELRIRNDRTFVIDPKHCYLNHPIYQFPFLQFAETTLAVNMSGISLNFLELLEELCLKANNGLTFNKLQNGKSRLSKERKVFFDAIEKSWTELVSQQSVNASLLQQVSKTSLNLATTAREIVDDLFPSCGMVGAQINSEINRIWRNIHTASQHTLLRLQ